MWLTAALYIATTVVAAEPGVWRAILGPRTALLFGLLGPLIALASLQVSVIMSSRVNDARAAQQLSALLILPVTALFVAQLMGLIAVGTPTLWLGGAGLMIVNGLLLWMGVQVFQRETILTRWR
jgi:ABC-2 type transport system permease protein